MPFGLPDYLQKRLQRYPTNLVRPTIVATADRTLAARETGAVCSNVGATGAVIFNLPTNVYEGLWFSFLVGAAQNLSINPGDDHQIIALGATQSAGTAITANDEGESCDIVWMGTAASGKWIARVTGTWT